MGPIRSEDYLYDGDFDPYRIVDRAFDEWIGPRGHFSGHPKDLDPLGIYKLMVRYIPILDKVWRQGNLQEALFQGEDAVDDRGTGLGLRGPGRGSPRGCGSSSTPMGLHVIEHQTAAPVSIDPYVVASRHETIFEGSQVEGALSRRRRQTQRGGRQDLLGVDAHHKALAKEA